MSEGSGKEKFVLFTYCRFCVNKDKKDISEPCCDCLEHPTNIDSQRPIHFKDNGSLERITKSLKGE